MAYIGRDIDKISNVEVLDNITFDGSSSYTLQKGGSNFTPSSANTLLVSIDGVVQAGNFTVSGSTINFGTAVSASSTCNFILHYGVGLITAPADGTVTTAKLADSSVSLAKLTATGTKDATTFLRGDNTFAVPTAVVGSSGFFAHGNGGSNQTLSSAHSWTNITIFGTERYDIGNNFTSNVFTAPATGKYYLSVGLTFTNTSGSFLKVKIKSNALTSEGLASNGTNGADGNTQKTLGYSYILDMTSGQTAYPQVYSSETTVQVINNSTSYFNGMRIA